MKYEQMSMFDFPIDDGTEKQKIMISVERPEGDTFEQMLEVKPGQTIQQCIKDYQNNCLGNPYAWYTNRAGDRIRYLKKNAYLVVSWWLL